jgi:hypothetical protein
MIIWTKATRLIWDVRIVANIFCPFEHVPSLIRCAQNSFQFTFSTFQLISECFSRILLKSIISENLLKTPRSRRISRGLLDSTRRKLLDFRHTLTHTCRLPLTAPSPSAAKNLLPKSVRRNSCFLAFCCSEL